MYFLKSFIMCNISLYKQYFSYSICVIAFRPIALYLMPEQSLSDTHMFSQRHITALLHFGMLDSISIRGSFKQWTHQPKAQKNKALK